MSGTGDLAVLALTPHGDRLGRRLIQALGRGEVVSTEAGLRPTLHQLFQAGRPLVCIMALGIVVRILGPLARDKKTDPAVVVVDEGGRFAISVLGGHLGGANPLASEVAQALGATAVITTASEAMGLPAVDLIGREFGWKIEDGSQLTVVAAAVVSRVPIAVYQDVGSGDWWRPFGEWPAHFERIESWPDADYSAALVISDRICPDLPCAAVVYRPPSLIAGIGCRRGVPVAEIADLFQQVCDDHGLAPRSLGAVATATLKADEPGLREFAAHHDVPLRCYSLDELATVTSLPTPSEVVRRRIGIAGVAEPAALLAAGAPTLLVPKQRSRRVTVALARRRDA
jgi:cobalt-precorrin 5A hydrolase